jgi:hypothetical protein
VKVNLLLPAIELSLSTKFVEDCPNVVPVGSLLYPLTVYWLFIQSGLDILLLVDLTLSIKSLLIILGKPFASLNLSG